MDSNNDRNNAMEDLKKQLLPQFDEDTIEKMKGAKSLKEITDLLKGRELTDEQLELVSGGSDPSLPGESWTAA